MACVVVPAADVAVVDVVLSVVFKVFRLASSAAVKRECNSLFNGQNQALLITSYTNVV